MTIDDTLRDRIVTALRGADRSARNIEDRREARELVYLLTVAPVVATAEPAELSGPGEARAEDQGEADAQPENISPMARASMRKVSRVKVKDDEAGE